jgi:hypothetical protein
MKKLMTLEMLTDPPSVPLTPQLLTALAGVTLSLLASYLPGFSAWFNRLEAIYKRLVMLGLLAACSLAITGLSCAGLGEAFSLPPACDRGSGVLMVQAFLLALIANQSAYLITKG